MRLVRQRIFFVFVIDVDQASALINSVVLNYDVDVTEIRMMEFAQTLAFVGLLGQIAFVDGTLSIDN